MVQESRYVGTRCIAISLCDRSRFWLVCSLCTCQLPETGRLRQPQILCFGSRQLFGRTLPYLWSLFEFLVSAVAVKAPSFPWRIFTMISSSSAKCMFSILAFCLLRMAVRCFLALVVGPSAVSYQNSKWDALHGAIVISSSFCCIISVFLICVAHNLRMTLVESNYFGVEEEGARLQKHLDTAYKHFRAFVKSRKIQCSQPPFQEKMELGFLFDSMLFQFLCPTLNERQSRGS